MSTYGITATVFRRTVIAAILLITFLGLIPSARLNAATCDNTCQDIDGKFRVWATNFVKAGDITTATGNVVISPVMGDINTGKYFSVSESASWSSSGPITLTGVLGLFQANKLPLISGKLSVDRAKGDVTWTPGSATVQYRKLGNSEVAITPEKTILTINVLKKEIGVTAQINLSLPENDPATLANMLSKLQFTLNSDGTVTSTLNQTVNINLNIAKGTLTAKVNADNKGLVASEAEYKLDGIGALTLKNLVIDGKGDTKLGFGINAERQFNIPDINIANGFFILNNLKGEIGLDTTSGSLSYRIALTQGQLILRKLPKNAEVQVGFKNVQISNGKLSGELNDFTLSIAGQDTDFAEVSFDASNIEEAINYFIQASKIQIPVPQAWTQEGSTPDQLEVDNVVLDSKPPFLKSIGAESLSFTFDPVKTFFLAGDENANPSVSFDLKQGSVTYDSSAQEWQIKLDGTNLEFCLEGECSDITADLTIANGSVTAELKGIDLNLTIAGLQLSINDLSYKDESFGASNAKWTGLSRHQRDEF